MNVLSRTITNVCNLTKNGTNKTQRLASTFKTAVLKKPGEPLQLEEKSQEKLKSNQVRVKVAYASLNSVDCYKFKQGDPELPFYPGYELSGNVIELGKNVSKEKAIVGDRVVGLNLNSFGGIAEECILDQDDIWRIPGEVDRKDAAVLAYGHSTAIYALAKLTTIKEKEQVIVTAGPAGMGLAAVDVAANIYGATVIGVVDNEDLGELVRNSGAFKTILFGPKLQKEVLKETSNKGVNVVYDGIGDHMMKSIGTCASIGGKIFHAAPFFYETVPAPTPHSFLSIVSLKALRKQNIELYKSIVDDTLELANEGVINAHVSANFELKDINEAVKFIDNKKCTGKVLIHIN